MSKLLVKPTSPDPDGRVLRVTPESAGWGHVGFEVFNLKQGQNLTQSTGADEVCLVILTGRLNASTGDYRLSLIHI